MRRGESSSKKVVTKEEWEKNLREVKIWKEDMNRLVMNFLVTEGYVDAVKKFLHESGTQRILCNSCKIVIASLITELVGHGMALVKSSTV